MCTQIYHKLWLIIAHKIQMMYFHNLWENTKMSYFTANSFQHMQGCPQTYWQGDQAQSTDPEDIFPYTCYFSQT